MDCLFVWLVVCLIDLFACLVAWFFCWSVGLLFVCLFVCLLGSLFVCLLGSLFVCLFVCLVLCLFVCLLGSLFVCLFVCLFGCRDGLFLFGPLLLQSPLLCLWECSLLRALQQQRSDVNLPCFNVTVKLSEERPLHARSDCK